MWVFPGRQVIAAAERELSPAEAARFTPGVVEVEDRLHSEPVQSHPRESDGR
jgi:hypothetical protein